MTRAALAMAGIVAALAMGAATAPAAAPSIPPSLFAAAVDTADADTTLGGFLRQLSDSTDRYFGVSAAETDTAGLDSALAYGLTHPNRERGQGWRPDLWPDFAFNRVDGPVWGGGVGWGVPRRLGRISGHLAYAAGPNVWHGGAEYRKTMTLGDAAYSFMVSGGRMTASMDREHYERKLATLRALIAGKDYRRYYRRDGFETRLERETANIRLAASYRDMLESPLAVTTTWNFAGRTPAVIDNLPARFGRVHEFGYEAGWRLPWFPALVEISHQTASHSFGSDFEYRRTRLAAGLNVGLGAVATLLPQVVYGRVTESALPQTSFYLGGSHTLRSLRGSSRGGTGLAVARVDVIGAGDVLEWAHIPHPAAFPIQVGVFAGIGAVWGVDPYGGPTVPGDEWPHRDAWLSEVGASLIYQPGFPDPTGFFRLNYAVPLGPDRLGSRWTLSYARAFDLLRLFRH
jgi:hypothetical protein